MSNRNAIPSDGTDSHRATVLEHLEAMTVVIDTDWRIEYANEYALERFQCTLSECTGQPLLQVMEGALGEDNGQETVAETLRSVFSSTHSSEAETVTVDLVVTEGTARTELTIMPVRTAEGVTGATVISQEVAPQKTQEQEQAATEEILEMLYQTSTGQRSFEEKVAELLAFGCEYLGIEHGFLTEIDGGTQRIVAGSGTNDQLQTGQTAPVEESYCRKTVSRETTGPLIVLEARDEGWESDPGFERFGLACYIGSTVSVDGDVYGTLCFADRDPRETAFTDSEQSFVQLLTEWVRYELEHRNREDELERHNDLFRKAQDIAAVGAWEYDVEKERSWLSEKAYEIHGTSPTDPLPPERSLEFYNPDYRDRVRNAFRGAIERGEPYDITAKFTDAEGTVRWVQTRGEPKTVNGTVTRIRGTIQDITEQQKTQQNLEEYASRLEGLFSNSPDMIFVHDGSGTIHDVNQRMCEELGLSEAELLSRKIWELDTLRNSTSMSSLWDGVETGDRNRMETRFVRADDSELPVEINLTRLERTGTVRFLAVCRDITERKQREKALIQSKKRLSIALKGADAGVWEWDPKTDEVYLHESCERLFGLEPGTFEGTYEAFRQHVHEEDIAGVDATIAETVPQREPFETEYRIIRADGETRWAKSRGEFIVAEESPRYIGVITDITQQKEREAELRRKNRAIDSAPVGITIADTTREDNPTVYANDRFVEMTGYSNEEILNRNCRFLQGEETDAAPVREVRNAIDANEPVSVELLNYRNDGSSFWNNLKIAPVENEDGDVTHYVGFQQDVSHRKAREQRLQETKQKLEAVLDTIFAAVFMKDTEGRYLLMNHRCRQLLGIDEETNVVGLTDYDIFSEEEAKQFIQDDRVVFEQEETVVIEEDVPSVDGTKPHLTRKTPVYNENGELYALCGVATDVGDLKQRERELEQFAYVASHDLREPLRVISNYLQLLERRHGDSLDEDASQYVEYAVNAAERMKDLIEGLLTYSRIESRGDEFERFELDDALSDALANLEIAITQSEASIRTTDLPEINGDKDQFVTVFQNILDNAITYAGDQPPEIELRVEERPSVWILTVADSGVGMDADRADRAFELFERLHGGDTDGTGLGLALCEKIIEHHGGSIWIDSEREEGTEIHFTLPKPEKQSH